MALNARELLLILRARDEASRVLRNFSGNLSNLNREAAQAAAKTAARGAALATLGSSLAFAGAMGVGALNAMTNAAVAYNQETAKTLTQVDRAGVSFEQLKQMGIDVGNTVPAAFEQMQPALYDIFSSIETNGPGARILLENIAKAAVGGAVSMEEAGRAAITILNAYGMKVQDVTKVNDVMFQLVRKGVGTYQEFTSTIGRAIPSGVKAGQTFEDVAGALAFMTRNGLSTAMSATSVARAMDAMANPKTISKFKEFGVDVVDARGKFRPLAEVMVDLRKKLQDLTPAARAAKLSELFKGSGGTIQAMRFFNLAIADGSGLLQNLTKDMHNAGGAAKEAYDVMANTPQAQLQLMNNRYEIMKTIVGDQLLPVKLKLAQALSSILNWFNSLSPTTQAWIVKIVSLATVLAVVIGSVMAVVGVVLMFVAAAAMAGVGLGALIGIVTGVVAVLGLLVAAGFLVYKNWDTIREKATAVWNAVLGRLKAAWAGFEEFRNNIVQFAQEVWSYLQPIATKVWNDIKAGISSMMSTVKPFWDQFVAAVLNVWNHVQEFASGVGTVLGNLFNFLKPLIYVFIGALGILASIVGGVLRAAFEGIGIIIAGFLQVLTGVIDFIFNVFTGQWGAAWSAVLDIGQGLVRILIGLFQGLVKAILSIVVNLVTGVINFFKHLWDVLVGHSIIPDMVKAIIQWIASLPGKIFAIIASLVSGFISRITSMASTIIGKVTSFIGDVVRFFAGMPGKVVSAVSRLASDLYSQATKWLSRMKSGVTSGWNTVMSFIRDIPGKVVSALSGLGSQLWNIGSNIMHSMASGISSAASSVARAAGSAAKAAFNAAKDFLSFGSPSKLFIWVGEMTGEGLAIGLRNKVLSVGQAGEALAAAASSTTTANLVSTYDNRPPVVPGYGGPGGGPGRPPFEINVYTEEINPVKHAADLGYEIAARLGE